MASTFTGLGIEKPGSGDYSNTWDVPANRNYDLLDDSIAGVVQIAILDVNTTLTIPDATSSPNRKMVIEFTGALTASRDVTFAPADMTKMVIVTNSTTGGFSLVFKQGAAAATVTLPAGLSTIIAMDGSDEVRNVIAALSITSLTATTVAATNVTVGGQNAVPANRTISVAGAGLAGGGDLSANRTITLDVNTMTEDTAPDMDADFVAGYDTSGTANKKVKMINYIPELNRKGSDIASAATLVKPADANLGLWHDITGVTPVSAFWNEGALNRLLFVRFTGILTFTNGANLALPGGANITTAANDRAIMYGLGAGAWICVSYIRATGQPVTQLITASYADDSITYPKMQNVTTSRVLGRMTAGSGDMEELTLGAGLLNSGTALQTSFGAQLLQVQDQKASGTDGGTPTAGAWTKHTLDDVVTNEISGASQASSVITLPVGTYYIEGWATAYRSNGAKIRWRNTSDSTTAIVGLSTYNNSGGAFAQGYPQMFGRFTVSGGAKNFELQYWIESAVAAGVGLGNAVTTGEVEIYADARIWKIA